MDHHHAHGNEHQGKETGPTAARRQRHHRPAPPPVARWRSSQRLSRPTGQAANRRMAFWWKTSTATRSIPI